MKDPNTPRLKDDDAERARRRLAECIQELQSKPAVSANVIASVSLASGVSTPVSHGLGREPKWVGVSVVRGPSTVGMVEEVRATSTDRTKQVLLKASGYGATVTVDVAVM